MGLLLQKKNVLLEFPDSRSDLANFRRSERTGVWKKLGDVVFDSRWTYAVVAIATARETKENEHGECHSNQGSQEKSQNCSVVLEKPRKG
jgi:hypothetical protein